jgi:hypothetical protein
MIKSIKTIRNYKNPSRVSMWDYGNLTQGVKYFGQGSRLTESLTNIFNPLIV